MTIVRVGATKKYSDGWEAAFGKGKKKSTSSAKPNKPAAKKKSKASAKKRPAKTKKKSKK